MAKTNNGHRPYPLHTPLARLMNERQLHKASICGALGISDRLLTEYLAGRKQLRPDHVAVLSDYFDVDPEDLTEGVVAVPPAKINWENGPYKGGRQPAR